MATKIGGFDSSPVQVSTGRAVKRAGNADGAASSGKTSSTSDTQITESARSLVALEQTIRDLPAIDEARVQQISARLANGSYQIDAGRIADKLLSSEKDLADLN